INRKLGREKVRYPHPALEEILAPTYGVIVYQEQVMRIANVLAGYSLAEADVLRKAVGKKIKELIQEELGNFVKRAIARGHEKKTVEEIAAQIETFVGDRRIRFGLGAVRNVGEVAIASIIAGRQSAPYRSLVELCDRIDLRLCNKRVIESLIDSGACDSLGGERSQLVAALDHAFS